MVVVDVVVTDGDDKAVIGLKPTDFEIRENGRVQMVRAFGVYEPALTGRDAPQPVLPAGIFTNVPDFKPDDGPPTVVLIDALNTLPADQPYMRQNLLQYLESIGPRHNVAIYTLSHRLRLLQDFTNDPLALQEAIKKFAMHPSSLNQDPNSQSDLDFSGDGLESSGNLPEWKQVLKDFQAEQDAVVMDTRVNITMEALKGIARNVAGYPGRKNLIWLSGAFPFYVEPDSGLSDSFISQRQYADQIRKAATILTDAQVAVYPVDARGLVGSLMPDASVRGRTRITPTTAGSLQSSHDTMNEIAKQTGGRAFYNRNDLGHAVALSVEDGSAYYTLGYYPEDKNWDGKFRKIEIRLSQRGLKVRSRKGYFATAGTVATDAGERAGKQEFLNSLSLEAPLATTLPFVVQIAQPTKNEPSVTINFGVDPHSIAFYSLDDNLSHAELEFVTQAFDLKGKLISSQSEDLATALKPETYGRVVAGRLGFSQKINIVPGRYILKIGVRDKISNLTGTLTAKIDVPSRD
jgi:VWFA-related protein